MKSVISILCGGRKGSTQIIVKWDEQVLCNIPMMWLMAELSVAIWRVQRPAMGVMPGEGDLPQMNVGSGNQESHPLGCLIMEFHYTSKKKAR